VKNDDLTSAIEHQMQLVRDARLLKLRPLERQRRDRLQLLRRQLAALDTRKKRETA
jgi:hypothetical protein